MQNNNERQEETRNSRQNLSEQANSAQGQNNVESGENLRSVIHHLNEDINRYRNICEDDIQDIKEGRVFVGDAFNQYRILEYETHIRSLRMISGEVSKIIRELRDNNIDKKQKLSELAGMRAQYERIANTIDGLNEEMLKYEQISRGNPETVLQKRITELENDYRYMMELSNKIANTNNDKKYEHAIIIRDHLWEKTEDELQKLKKEQSDIVNKKIDKMISECKKRGQRIYTRSLRDIKDEYNNDGFSESLLRDYNKTTEYISSRMKQPSHIIYINKDAYKLIKDIESIRKEMKSILEYVKKNSFWGDKEDYSFYKNIDNELNYLGELCEQLKTNIAKQEDTIPLDNNQVNLLDDSYNKFVGHRPEIERIKDGRNVIKTLIDLYKYIEELQGQCVQREGLFTNSESGKFNETIRIHEKMMQSSIKRLLECKDDLIEGARKILEQQTISSRYLDELLEEVNYIETALDGYNQEIDRVLILNPELRAALNEDAKRQYEDVAYEEGSDISTEEIEEATRVEGDTEDEVDIEPEEVAEGNIALSASKNDKGKGKAEEQDRKETEEEYAESTVKITSKVAPEEQHINYDYIGVENALGKKLDEEAIREQQEALKNFEELQNIKNEQRTGKTQQQENKTESRKGDLNAASTSGSNTEATDTESDDNAMNLNQEQNQTNTTGQRQTRIKLLPESTDNLKVINMLNTEERQEETRILGQEFFNKERYTIEDVNTLINEIGSKRDILADELNVLEDEDGVAIYEGLEVVFTNDAINNLKKILDEQHNYVKKLNVLEDELSGIVNKTADDKPLNSEQVKSLKGIYEDYWKLCLKINNTPDKASKIEKKLTEELINAFKKEIDEKIAYCYERVNRRKNDEDFYEEYQDIKSLEMIRNEYLEQEGLSENLIDEYTRIVEAIYKREEKYLETENLTADRNAGLDGASTSVSNNMTAENEPDHDSTSISSNDSFLFEDSDVNWSDFESSISSNNSNDSSLPTDTDQVQISVVEQNSKKSQENPEPIPSSVGTAENGPDHDSADSVVSVLSDDSIISLNGLGIMGNQLSVSLNPNPAPGPIGEIEQAAESDTTRSDDETVDSVVSDSSYYDIINAYLSSVGTSESVMNGSDDNAMNLNQEQNQTNTTADRNAGLGGASTSVSNNMTAENGTTRSNSVVSVSSNGSIISLYAASESFGDSTYSTEDKCSCFTPIKKMVMNNFRKMVSKCKSKCFTN